jgi:ATP-dependent helicase/nuclease subunit A
MQANVSRLLELVPRLAEVADLQATVDAMVGAARVVGTERDKAWPSAEVYEAVKAAFEDFRQDFPAQLKRFLETPDDLTGAAVVGQRFLGVAEEATEAYRLLKRRNAVVDFQDLLVLARNLLRDHPEVRERLQKRYRFLLIDELQDTDPVQMELVEHLSGGGLTAGKLFAVGDHSQSIYRFRGADVSLFQGLRWRMPHEGRLGLTVNFRSQPAILDFTNALLGPGVAGPPGLEDYAPLQAHHAQLNPGPCVEFLWAPREDKETVNQARTREAEWIARRIAGLVSRGEPLVADRSGPKPRLRPVRQGDIVLLFRAMTNVEIYEAALRRHGLDYYLVGGRAFFAQQEIYDLLNLLRALENPQDAVSLAGTLRSPFCCLSDEALFLIGQHPDGLWAGLHDPALMGALPADQRERAERARRGHERWRGLKDRLPIARMLGEVFADTGYDAATQFEFLGDRKLANLWKLVDLARTFDRSGLFGMAEFIQRLGDLVRSQPREEQAATQPESADVVRLMTVHQAKGLEFPVVIIPDVSAAGGGPRNPVAHWDARLGCVTRPPGDEPPPFSDLAWRLWQAAETVEDWREDLRTLYVACTRAEDYLVLSAALPRDYSPANAWMLKLAERFDLRDGHCLDPDIPPERRPLVRVTDALAPPPEAALVRAGAAPEDPALPTLPELSTEANAVAPDSILLLPASGAKPSGAGFYHFDAEDGSDRSAWAGPRQRLEGDDDSAEGRRDRTLRAVLERWDMQDPDGWRPLLAEILAAQPGLAETPALRADLERLLARFAQGDLFGQLRVARLRRHDVEFLLKPTGADRASPPAAPTALRGVMDLLWQDPEGGWHVAAVETGLLRGDGRADDWHRRQPTLALWAAALEQSLGVPPQTVSCYYTEEGILMTRNGRRLGFLT